MNRYLSEIIRKDLEKKMVFIAGPRQVGKTTLSLSFLDGDTAAYLNWDVPEGREHILKRNYPIGPIVIFDEIHKFKSWKSYLKGVYDDPKRTFKVIVTGSAKLDLYQKGGDSLQGRYHLLRLHPFSVKELNIDSKSKFEELLERGGFPEPYLSGSLNEAKRWLREYRSRLIQEEVRSIEQIEDLGKLELLVIKLPEHVGSPLSINSLREDLQVAHKTVERWLKVLERLYAVFPLSPVASTRIKSLRKSKKYYFYNWSFVDNVGSRFENLVASHLLKWIHYQQDVFGRDVELSYVRDSSQREVDFAIVEKNKVLTLIECKVSETQIDDSLKYFSKRFSEATAVQLVQNLNSGEGRVIDGIKVLPALDYLKTLV